VVVSVMVESITVGAEEARETRALVQIALEKMKRSLFVEARHDLQEALRLDPEHAVALSYFGLCLAQLGTLDQGMVYCERAVRLAPEDATVRVNLGKVHRLAGDMAAAHRSFVRAWSADKRNPMAATELARMGVRRPPVLRFLPRSNWCNRELGRLRARIERKRVPGPRR
jgi:Flp pilus assembly protein TadD